MRLVHARSSLAFLLVLAFAAPISAQTPKQVPPLMEGVTAHSFSWTGNNSFSLSLVNNLRDPVGNVNCVVVFYNKEGLPLDSAKVSAPVPQLDPGVWVSGRKLPINIEPGVAIRVVGQVPDSVVPLISSYRVQIIGFEVLN